MNRLYIPIGPSNCGKSTWGADAKKINSNIKIISSDEIRGRLYGDESFQGDPKEVFKIMQEEAIATLKLGFDVYYDATNLKRKDRAEILAKTHKFAEARAIIFATDYEDCCLNQQRRDRKVSPEIIRRQIKQFDMPFLFEGFTQIFLINRMRPRNFNEWINESYQVPHDNPHHPRTIGEHCIEVGMHFNSHIPHTGALHDCGKLFTKDFHNSKGEPSLEAHYYGHENASAYFSFAYDRYLDDDSLIARAQIIALHMKLWTCGERKLIYWQHRIPEWMWEELKALNEADRKYL